MAGWQPVVVPHFILLPPSEAKYVPRRGNPLDLSTLSFPSLTSLREALLDDDLGRPRRRPRDGSHRRPLRGARHRDAPAGRGSHPGDRLRPVRCTTGTDRVPAYECEMSAAHWRSGLREPLDDATRDRVIVDCRSATYVTAWRPPPQSAGGAVHVSVVEERDGVRRVVSHMAKKTRGEVARHLLVSRVRVRTAADVAAAVSELFACELAPPVKLVACTSSPSSSADRIRVDDAIARHGIAAPRFGVDPDDRSGSRGQP